MGGIVLITSSVTFEASSYVHVPAVAVDATPNSQHGPNMQIRTFRRDELAGPNNKEKIIGLAGVRAGDPLRKALLHHRHNEDSADTTCRENVLG